MALLPIVKFLSSLPRCDMTAFFYYFYNGKTVDSTPEMVSIFEQFKSLDDSIQGQCFNIMFSDVKCPYCTLPCDNCCIQCGYENNSIQCPICPESRADKFLDGVKEGFKCPTCLNVFTRFDFEEELHYANCNCESYWFDFSPGKLPSTQCRFCICRYCSKMEGCNCGCDRTTKVLECPICSNSLPEYERGWKCNQCVLIFHKKSDNEHLVTRSCGCLATMTLGSASVTTDGPITFKCFDCSHCKCKGSDDIDSKDMSLLTFTKTLKTMTLNRSAWKSFLQEVATTLQLPLGEKRNVVERLLICIMTQNGTFYSNGKTRKTLLEFSSKISKIYALNFPDENIAYLFQEVRDTMDLPPGDNRSIRESILMAILKAQ